MSSFSSLNVGSLAIHAAQRGLDVTGQNIANSATVGYSRQRVDQVAIGGPTVPAIHSKYDGIGGGVRFTGVSRMRDEFLEARARTAHQNLGDLEETQRTYEAIERTLGEPSNTGLKQRMAEFWNAWSTAGNDLNSQAPRDVVVERGKAVADELNRISRTLEVQWADTRTQLDANVTDVNKAVDDIATLNRAIRNNVINGLPANELADQRDQLVEKVTTLTGAVAERAEDGMVNVKLGDGYMVSGYQSRHVGVVNGDTGADYATWQGGGSKPFALGWAQKTDGTAQEPPAAITASIGRSTMGAQMTALNTTVPSYLDKLDSIAVSIANTVNTQNTAGYTVGGAKGEDLMTGTATTKRAAITISWVGASAGLALSSTDPTNTVDPTTGQVTAYGKLNGDNAKAMAAHVGDQGGADDQFRAVVVALGVEAASVYRNQSAAANVAKTADDARDTVSGVSLNEEMTNLVKYQHSFSAAAKYITTVDATIESLLNMVR